jgi:hypothetical protein
MSITNNNPFLINILSIGNTQSVASGLDPFTTLRRDVNDIQEMVDFADKRINVDVIAAYNQTKIQVVNDINVNNSVLSINDIPVVSGDWTINNFGGSGGSGSEFMGSNSYKWTFPPSTIGGSGIKDATGIPRSNADTYTNAITKLDYWMYENLVDQPPAPTYVDIGGSESNIRYYWSNPTQIKLGVINQWVPYMSSLTMSLYSNVTPTSSNYYGAFTVGIPYVPHSSNPVQGVEFNNRATPGSISYYSNAAYNAYILQIGVDSASVNINNGPYSLVVNFANFSINPVKSLGFGSNNFVNLVERAPLLSDFTVALNNNGSLSVNIVPTTRTGTYLTPDPGYYYSISGATDLTSSNPPGRFDSGKALGVTPISCGYDQNFTFSIYASNAVGRSATSNISASTGLAPLANTPTVSLSLSANYTNGHFTATYSTSAQDGTLNWRFTQPVPNTPSGTGVVTNATYTYDAPHYFQYFDGDFIIQAFNSRACRQNSATVTATQRINYTVPTPVVTVSLVGSAPPYTITATVPVPSLAAVLTYSTTWAVLSGTFTGTPTTTNTTFSGQGSTTFYTIGATYTYIDTASETRTSARGQGSVSAGPVAFTFPGSMGPDDSVTVVYPANAVVGTPSATISGGYLYTGTPAPGNTITFQRSSPDIRYGATYEWGYSIQY